jgi:predicted RNA-binding Zn-ribbon protein involved in translation (DUF1610 family)
MDDPTLQLLEDAEPAVCNCNDEFKTTVCPVHSTVPTQEAGMIVMDEHMVEEEVRPLIGYCFNCPNCKEPSILDMMKYCPACGKRIILRSHKVTAFINQVQGDKKA